MKPKPQQTGQRELFRQQLIEVIDRRHELAVLGERINWARFDEQFGSYFNPQGGRPGIPTRLMVGVHYLKHLHNLSDELVIKRWRENPYWQYFCGCEYFEHRFPFERSSMSRWRKKIGKQGVEELLKESLSVAHRSGAFELKELTKLLADTTVQEKNITYPTDVKLYHRAREFLVKVAKRVGLELRQSYVVLSKRWLLRTNRYSAAKQLKRATKACKKVRNYLGRVLREVERQIAGNETLQEVFQRALSMSRRVYMMKESGEKIYSLHEPSVECIAKGKAHKRYEFGVKVSVVTSAKSGYIVSCDAYHGRPHDGKTLKPSLEDAAQTVGKELSTAMISVDRGYGGHGLQRGRVIHPNLKKLSKKNRKFIRRRSAIEATISHMKRCFRLGRNYLSGVLGDHLNAKLSASAYNLSKLLRLFSDQQYT